MSVARRSRVVKALVSLCILAVLTFALCSLRLSDASLTAASANPANVFVAGTLAHVNDRNNQLLISASGFDPNDAVTGTMTLTGTGDVAGDYHLRAASLVDTPASPPLSDTLELAVVDVTGAPATLYNGSVAGFSSEALGTIAPGATRRYRITLLYPDGPVDGDLQGASMRLLLEVIGESQ